MSRFTRAAAGASIAVLAGSALAPPAVAAATAPPAPPPSHETRGVLDGLLGGLGGLLGSLLGTNQQAQLQQLLGLLQRGEAPTGSTLAPLTSILGQLGAAQGLPAGTQGIVQQLTSLLGSGRGGLPLDPSLLTPVASLLRQLAATQGIPAPATALLNQLADALTRGGIPGLPIGDLPLDTGSLAGLASVLDALARGGEPTGQLLAPLLPLLRQVAGTPGLPPELKSLVDQLIAAIQTTTGTLDPLLVDQLGVVLSMIGNTPGVSRETRTAIERTVTVLGTRTLPGTGSPGGTGRQGSNGGNGSDGSNGSGGGGRTPTGTAVSGATKRDRATIKRVAIDGSRGVVSVRIACPARAPAACATTVRVGVSGWPIARAVRAQVPSGTAKVVKLRVTRGAKRQLARRGGRLAVNATTAFGQQRFVVRATLKVPRIR